MLLFLDTEFTQVIDGRLISLGLVAQTGEEFYAELPVSGAYSEFVRDTVVPLLGREPFAHCEDDYVLGTRLRTWLSLVKRAEPLSVCFDLELDWELFKAAVCSVPGYCLPRLLDGAEIIELLRESFFRKTGLPEHHALYDARALCYSFRERI